MRRAGLAALLVVAPGLVASRPVDGAPACKVPKSVYAIVDDSGSMAATDPGNLRLQGLKLFKSLPGNSRKSLGAAEFGSDAQPLFGLMPIRRNSAAMDGVLAARLVADDGGTDYNAAFAVAKAGGAGAERMIFITDGGHVADEGPYAEGHRFGKKIDVIGLDFIPGDPDNARLARIAKETGGLYKRAEGADAIQTAINEISAAMNCRRKPVSIEDVLGRPGRSEEHSVDVRTGERPVLVTATWPTAGDAAELGSFTLETTVERARRGRPRKRKTIKRRLKAAKRRGPTFQIATVELPEAKRSTKAKLLFRVKARKVTDRATGLEVTTQASRSGKR